MSKYLRIIYCVAICLAVGYLSSNVTQSSISTWYPEIKKPSFNPPNWVFAPVWTMLFILMGIAAGMVWNKLESNKELVKKGLLFFTVQLLLNALWSYLFFGLNNILINDSAKKYCQLKSLQNLPKLNTESINKKLFCLFV